MNRARFWFPVSLILLATASRFIPHPPNVTPVAALALFGGATLPNRWAALLVPLAALVLSDLLLHVSYLAGWQPLWGFYPDQWAVYGCFLATACLGTLIRGRRTPLGVSLATVAGALLFFLVTNFVVWAGGTMYPKSASGLLTCYTRALPFFRASLVGDILYATSLFGALALAEAGFPALRPHAPRTGNA